MKRLLVAIAATALTSYCGLSDRPATLEAKLEYTADFLNRNGAEISSREFGNTRLESEVVNKDTLVLRILDTPTGYQTLDPNAARKILRSDLCEMSSVRQVFESGGKIRIKMISNIGVEVVDTQFAQC